MSTPVMKGITRCLSCWLASGQNKRPQPNNPDATAVSAGDRLGHDEVTGLVGEGGMGVVYIEQLDVHNLIGVLESLH